MTSILVGEDPSDPEALWEKMYYQTNRFGRRGAAIHAISGADIALWDIRGKIEGKPVSQLLGGPLRSDVRAYASVLFGDTPDETARMASEYVQMGLTAMKFGWGPLGPDAEVDLAHVRAARQAIGPDLDLMVDRGPRLGLGDGTGPHRAVQAVQPHLAGRAGRTGRPARIQ